LIKNVIKKTEKIRYKFVKLVIKRLTPVLYDKMGIMSLIGVRANYITVNFDIVPRSSVIAMKKTFNERLVKGAEIGVASGINSKSILKELNVEKLYLIDVWDNYAKYKYRGPITENYKSILKKFKNDKRVEIIKDFSSNAVKSVKDNSLDFVYIDANHTYKYVYQDIELWTLKVKDGGIIAGHDVF